MDVIVLINIETNNCEIFYAHMRSPLLSASTEGAPVDEDGYMDTDKVDFLFFGLVVGFKPELGYFSLNEPKLRRKACEAYGHCRSSRMFGLGRNGCQR